MTLIVRTLPLLPFLQPVQPLPNPPSHKPIITLQHSNLKVRFPSTGPENLHPPWLNFLHLVYPDVPKTRLIPLLEMLPVQLTQLSVLISAVLLLSGSSSRSRPSRKCGSLAAFHNGTVDTHS